MRLEGDHVILPPGCLREPTAVPPVRTFANGATALMAGRRMTPEAIALAAALGMTRLSVRASRPGRSLFHGNEIVSPHAAGFRPAL